jgi:hypothetical protein
MDSHGERTLQKVLAAPEAEAALRELSDQALVDLLRHTDDGPGWAARLVNGIATLEAARRFRLDGKEPHFP